MLLLMMVMMMMIYRVFLMLIYRVFGVTLDEDDDEREGDHTAAEDDETLLENADNPTNLFSSATGRYYIHLLVFCRLSLK